MKLTCVTATFNVIKSGNRENLIRCVKSVAALKTEHEHLIYDGASTDGTVELLRELEKEINGKDATRTSRLRVVSEKDTGIYNALNKGVRDAKGEWFYVLGADDYICHPDVLDGLMNVSDDAQIIVAPVERDEGYPYFQKDVDLAFIFWRVPYSHQGSIMRTGVVREFGGFDERFRICADWDLMRKEHDAGLRYRYTYRSFAHYAMGGVSVQGKQGLTERNLVICEHAGINLEEFNRSQSRGYYPLRLVWKYLHHKDYAYRIGARQMARRFIKSVLRIALYPIVVATRPIRCRKCR